MNSNNNFVSICSYPYLLNENNEKIFSKDSDKIRCLLDENGFVKEWINEPAGSYNQLFVPKFKITRRKS